jgi:hypothetical protein
MQRAFLADMAYNIGMAYISLVLPFALPAPEFASDLIRALEAPALAALLSRHADAAVRPLEAPARVLPHELWIARALGLAQGLTPAFGAAAMRGLGLDPGTGTWFVVNPAHIQIAHSHLMLGDVRQLDLRDEDARALFDAARECAELAGRALVYGDAGTWFLRADDWDELGTASPDAAVGMNLTDWMPSGPPARALRKLQNEVQMAWHTHPVNAARESRGQSVVNGFWPWAGASIATEHAQRLLAQASGKAAVRPQVATFESPGWLNALAEPELRLDTLPAVVDAITKARSDLLVACGNVAAPAIAADWSGWLTEMGRLEAGLFAPLHELLARGRIKSLCLVLSHRDGHLDTLTTTMAQRKFWRRPSLERLT